VELAGEVEAESGEVDEEDEEAEDEVEPGFTIAA